MIIILTSIKYAKTTYNSHTNMGVLMIIIAILAVLDSLLTHCFVCIFNMISNDLYLEQQIQYLKNLISLVLNGVNNLLIFMFVRIYTKQIKELQNTNNIFNRTIDMLMDSFSAE